MVCSLALAVSLAGCAGLPDQRLANEALKRGDTATAAANYQQLADLGFAVAQFCQLLVVRRRGGGIATLERFVGQALVGQTGTTAEADCQGQRAERESPVGASLLANGSTRFV